MLRFGSVLTTIIVSVASEFASGQTHVSVDCLVPFQINCEVESGLTPCSEGTCDAENFPMPACSKPQGFNTAPGSGLVNSTFKAVLGFPGHRHWNQSQWLDSCGNIWSCGCPSFFHNVPCNNKLDLGPYHPFNWTPHGASNCVGD
jgi:hypothetical protein